MNKRPTEEKKTEFHSSQQGEGDGTAIHDVRFVVYNQTMDSFFAICFASKGKNGAANSILHPPVSIQNIHFRRGKGNCRSKTTFQRFKHVKHMKLVNFKIMHLNQSVLNVKVTNLKSLKIHYEQRTTILKSNKKYYLNRITCTVYS